MRMNGKNIPWEPLVSIHLRLVGLPLFLFLIALTADISYSISANPLLHAAGFIVVSTGIPVALLNALIGLVRGEALGFATRAGRIASEGGIARLSCF